MAGSVEKWDPMSPQEVHELLSCLSVPWWIAGGWAIDLFLGRQTRGHDDIDVLIRRRDQLQVQQYLSDWDLHKTQQPGLKPWPDGEFLERPVDDIWCRRAAGMPWCVQLMLLDTDGELWVFKRDATIKGPLESIGRRTDEGIPYLTPEVQLLYKARETPIDKDRADFEAVLPLLGSDARKRLLEWLERRLPTGHYWVARLRSA